MKSPSIQLGTTRLHRLWAHDKMLDSLKVAVAFSGVLLFCFAGNHKEWLIGMILGVIAAALAETPDRLGGRVKALLVTFVCFAVAASSVRFLFPHPLLFAVGLALSTFTFVMLGALGERYGTIATASLILAIYTMLSLAQHGDALTPFWQEPARLLAGMVWYGCISLAATLMFPNRPLRRAVSRVFVELARYLELKARLLEPVGGRDLQALRLDLAVQNGKVVGLMNRAREILVLWTQIGRPAPGSQIYLQWYFLAQDVHERASSAHRPYEALAAAFAHSDVLFRCARQLGLQADACARLGEAIATGNPFDYGRSGALALAEMNAALAHVMASGAAYDTALAESLGDLCRNLGNIDARLAHAAEPVESEVLEDLTLYDGSPRSFGQMWAYLRREFTPSSRRFRHALRLATALTAGYALMQLLDLPQGFWVMLTTVFVCQPNFSSTWIRLGQRVGGTLLGLFVASLFIAAFPLHLAQLALIIASGVAFFFWRSDRYLLATACITVLVLLCFNQFGSSYALIWPRLLDTVLGCTLAVGAVALILPEWQGRRLHQVMAAALNRSAAYLAEIIAQYHSGKRDDLPYRIARRNAHNADAELSSTLTGMLGEPGRYHVPAEAAYRFLCASHTLLGYVSALGAHREKVSAWQTDAPICRRETRIQERLKAIAAALAARSAVPPESSDAAHASTDPYQLHLPENLSDAERRLQRQLDQIETQLPELGQLADGFAVLAGHSR